MVVVPATAEAEQSASAVLAADRIIELFLASLRGNLQHV
jgi:hypothetical protein